MKDLVQIIHFMLKRQQILVQIIIHLCCRADLYDNFVSMRLNDLQNLKAPDFKEKG